MPDLSNVQFRALRRETGLIQEDVAALLGLKDASSISRIERLEREPDIRTAFACEHILGAHARRLFEPLYAEAGRAVRERAAERLRALGAAAHDPRHAARVAHLAALAGQAQTIFDA